MSFIFICIREDLLVACATGLLRMFTDQVCMGCAHPVKFAKIVARALGATEDGGVAIPNASHTHVSQILR